MKAGNDNRVVLLGLDQAPWGVALGHDAAAEHVGDCVGLRDWLGVPDDAATVEFLLAGLSSRLAESMREEIEAAGKVSARDAEEAMTAVVTVIRRMEQAGELFLIVESEDDEVTIRSAETE